MPPEPRRPAAPPERRPGGAAARPPRRSSAEARRVPAPQEDPLADDPASPAGAAGPARTPAVRSGATPRRSITRQPRPRTLGTALLTTAAATVAPGSGHLMLRRRRSGALILGAFLLVIGTLVVIGLTVRTTDLVGNLISNKVLIAGALGCLVAAAAWIAVIVRTYILARPRGLDAGRQTVGVVVVTALCLLIAAPLGYAANLANMNRNFLNTLFPSDGGGTSVAEAIRKPRLNILLVGSDAGPDRTGARTDTMMVASIDTRSGRTTLFGLPRNVEYAQFPPGSPMAEQFPKGFHDPADPTSGNYLLNAVYAYGREFPAVAPAGPTADPGLNLLHQTVSFMLGLQLDYYVEVNMAGFASIIDALGGLTVDVGPEPIPIGGITPTGKLVKPDGYIEPGVQRLDGKQALAFARSRTGTTDYARMGRQRCLLQNILEQKSPTDLLANFQDVAKATTNSVSTNIPQQVLPALVSLAGEGTVALESVSFDPNLPDPSEKDGKFNTGRPNFPYMREVVQKAISAPPAAPAPPAASTPATPAAPAGGTGTPQSTPEPAATSAAPASLAATCG